MAKYEILYNAEAVLTVSPSPMEQNIALIAFPPERAVPMMTRGKREYPIGSVSMKKQTEKSLHTDDRIKMTDLARFSGVSKPTIYAYLKMGLLHQPIKASLGRSFYDSSHLVKLKRIRALRKDKKLPLNEIKRILQEDDHQSSLKFHEDETGKLMTALKEEKENIRSRKVDMKRNEILDAAIAVFSKNGYENTTVETIADHLQMGKSTVYLTQGILKRQHEPGHRSESTQSTGEVTDLKGVTTRLSNSFRSGAKMNFRSLSEMRNCKLNPTVLRR